jgi:photosystem II stability/assembly factor-like uncharacterized protein
MTERLVAIGTKKGLFIARRNGSEAWQMDGPHLLMNVVGAIGIDTRSGFPRLLAGTDHGHWGPSMSYSDDLGASWEETPRAPISFPEHTGMTLVKLWQIQAAGADQPGVVYAGTEPAALFRSDDGGLTFELVDGLWDHPDRRRLIEWIPESGMLYLHTVVVDPRGSDTITVGISAGGVYRTTDGGRTWAPSNTGIQSISLPQRYPEAGQCVHKIAMCPGAPQQLFLQNHGGVYRSDDDAATWTSISDGLPADFGFPIIAHPQRPGTAYVYPLGADTERMPLDRKCSIYRTRDAGVTWEALRQGLPQGPYFDTVLRDGMCVDDGDPAGIYFGTRGGQVFASEDEGDSWSCVAEHLPDVLCVRAVCVGEFST